ncbi:hypothetical protein MMC25_000071 [Agyrium rufum]|nr:hypothetical protein [Agyrium rufum]
MSTGITELRQPHELRNPLQRPPHPEYHTPALNFSCISMWDYAQRGNGGQNVPTQIPKLVPYPPPLQSPFGPKGAAVDSAGSETSEHMLRRKTPSGTLAAGYDGTPDEWPNRRHAFKHFMVSSEQSQGPITTKYTTVKPEHSSSRFIGSAGTDGRQQAGWAAMAAQQPAPIRKPSTINQMNETWGLMGLPGPSMDSMLNQHQSLNYYQPTGMGYNSVPTVLQPMWPPYSGPTAADKPAPHGPYWPDGSYSPYRPAALRDPTFIPASSPWGNSYTDGVLATKDRFDERLYSKSRSVTTQINYSLPLPQNQVPAARDRGWPPYHQESNFDLNGLALDSIQRGTEQIRLDAGHYHGNIRLSSQAFSPLRKFSRPQPMHGDSSLQGSAPVTFPGSPPKLQFKERILTWAHQAYTGLLASNQQQRKHRSNRYSPHERQSAHAKVAPPASSSIWHLSSSHESSRLGTEEFDVGNETCNRPSGLSLDASLQATHELDSVNQGRYALDVLAQLCQQSDWQWIDGMLLGGCLAYALAEYDTALQWYSKVLDCDANNVEATSNVAATLLSLNRKAEAEQYWMRSVHLRPSYFEAVEHLIGLLCGEHRSRDAVELINFVEKSLKINPTSSISDRATLDASYRSVYDHFDNITENPKSHSGQSFSSRRNCYINPHDGGFKIAGSDNGRMLALIHAKGNMLYSLGDNAGAAKAFGDAILIGTGSRPEGIKGLIHEILHSFRSDRRIIRADHHGEPGKIQTILLPPEMALRTASITFAPNGQLPGLADITAETSLKAALAIVSNSLLSLAKIYQDGISSGAATTDAKSAPGVPDILALYYLSLSLQPSPSTANNVGILLASVQQISPYKPANAQPLLPGVIPGSGIALALAYYKYGLELDKRHAHLYTNLGSLLKDIGQLNRAIEMYHKAVECDSTFDIALANLANAVKDQGRISDAIKFYKKAVASNPDFAEAVCGLANALNSICNWRGRGGVVTRKIKYDRWHVDEHLDLQDARSSGTVNNGLIGRVVSIVDKQLKEGLYWGRGLLRGIEIEALLTRELLDDVSTSFGAKEHSRLVSSVVSWAEQPWEGAKIVRLVERITRYLGWKAYHDMYTGNTDTGKRHILRPQLPSSVSVPTAPTVLPFHTFTCPLTAKQIRQISQRNGLRISCSTLRAPWLSKEIFPPPAPPVSCLNVGYVSSDFNNHPLAHLMQSVFGFHDKKRVNAICYATTPSDNSAHREQIEKEAPYFYDASSWSVERLVKQIVKDNIHILVNLNGYTRGARNEVFAARPAPIQMSFMGFAGTLGAEWCDYLLADMTAIPPSTLRPYRRNVDVHDLIQDRNYDAPQETDPSTTESSPSEAWVYGENIIFSRDTFFCCDHRQSAPDSQEPQLPWPEEQCRRWQMRKQLFPDLPDDAVILANFNQLYKIEPTTFRTWLRILARVRNAYLWLLRFPELGEEHLRETAMKWAPEHVVKRLIFTDVAPKSQHISRARICDLFVDTPECNAHTTAADVLWSGTPLLTYPRYDYKMCSRMAASILKGALPKTPEGERAKEDLIVGSDEEYEERAVRLANELSYELVVRSGRKDRNTSSGIQNYIEEWGVGKGRLCDLRKLLYEARWTNALFDTERWVSDLEDAYEEAWRKWVAGEGGDIWL